MTGTLVMLQDLWHLVHCILHAGQLCMVVLSQELLDEIDSTGGWGLLPLSLDLDVAGGSEAAGFIPMWSNCSDRHSKVWFIPEE